MQPGVIILSENSGTYGASRQSETAGDAWLRFVGSGEQVLMVSHHRIVLYSIIDEDYSGNKPSAGWLATEPRVFSEKIPRFSTQHEPSHLVARAPIILV